MPLPVNNNEGMCVRLNVIHTRSNWACEEVQNRSWQRPKPKHPGRMSTRYMYLTRMEGKTVSATRTITLASFTLLSLYSGNSEMLVTAHL